MLRFAKRSSGFGESPGRAEMLERFVDLVCRLRHQPIDLCLHLQHPFGLPTGLLGPQNRADRTLIRSVPADKRPNHHTERQSMKVLLVAVLAAAAVSVGAAGAASAGGCHIGGVSTVKADEVAALSKRAYDAAVHASVVHDNVGFQQLMRSGLFVPLNRGARLRILGGDFTHLQGRVVSNPGFQAIRGRIVWVDCSWLR